MSAVCTITGGGGGGGEGGGEGEENTPYIIAVCLHSKYVIQ